MIKVGLKTNAAFLYKETNSNNLGGYTDNLNHAAVICLNNEQFINFKGLISKFGYSVESSLTKIQYSELDYSCYLTK